ncbi:MAG: histidine kinase [Bacillota bacterium]
MTDRPGDQPRDRTAAGDGTAAEPGEDAGRVSSERFFGVQWRLLRSHAEVAVVAAVAGALFVGLPLAAGRGPGPAALLGVTAVALSALAGAYAGLRYARGVKQRLREAGRFASALARGDYGSRLSPGRPDEIGQLEEELNFMAESLEAAVAELRALAERNRLLAEEAGSLAALEERTRLARDLHDTVNQQVFSLSMQAAAARRRLEGVEGDRACLEEIRSALSGIEELARSAHRQLRDLILQLRPTTLEEQGLGPALEEYARTFAEAQGLACECDVRFDGRLDRRAEEALFRIAQEALNNVSKHARARTVLVRLELTAGREVALVVQDDGRGFSPAAPVRPTAVGLKGLAERAAAVGGRVRVESAPGRGTTVTAAVPAGGRRLGGDGEDQGGDGEVRGAAPAVAGPVGPSLRRGGVSEA